MSGGLSRFSWYNFDWALFASVLSLITIGIAAIYSVDLSHGGELVNFKKQLLALGLGTILLFWAASRQVGFFRSYAKWMYFACLILLLSVIFFGTTIRGTRGWFAVAGFSFQPVEVAKWGVILMLAYVVSRFGRRFERPLFFFGTGFLTLLAIGLVMLQPDLGSSLVLGFIWFGEMLLVKARKLYIFSLLGAGLVFVVFSWVFLFAPYQKDRVLTFIDAGRDPLGAGYNTTQAAIAIGSGQVLGRGLGFGSQSQLRFLPEAQTDFVFSVIGEELGLAGASIVLLLFAIMLWRLLQIVRATDDDFSATAVSGVALVFFCQLIVNIGANLGLLPVTGITLPFVSYGGSSLMINLLMIGMVESMAKKKF